MEQQVLLDAINSGKPINTTYPLSVNMSGTIAKVVTNILDVTPIAAAATTALADCTAIDMLNIRLMLAITVETTYNAGAAVGIKVHVRTSYDGVNYDTEDWDTWTPGFTAGASIRVTKDYDVAPAYVKVLIENLDVARSVTDTKVYSTLG